MHNQTEQFLKIKTCVKIQLTCALFGLRQVSVTEMHPYYGGCEYDIIPCTLRLKINSILY